MSWAGDLTAAQNTFKQKVNVSKLVTKVSETALVLKVKALDTAHDGNRKDVYTAYTTFIPDFMKKLRVLGGESCDEKKGGIHVPAVKAFEQALNRIAEDFKKKKLTVTAKYPPQKK